MNIKSFFLIVLFSVLCFASFSQGNKLTYKLIENLPYSGVYEGEKTDYMLERCKLDIYYPENKKDFVTVVWFHGGGMTGRREIYSRRIEK